MIEGGIGVERVIDRAAVESLDRAARTVVLRVGGSSLPPCRVARSVRNWGDIHIGDEVVAKVEEVLTVYVAPATDGGGPGVGAPSLPRDARVLVADPGYRVLTIQYPDGDTKTFKLGLHARMQDIEAGDAVAIRLVRALELRVRRHSHREGASRSSAGAAAL